MGYTTLPNSGLRLLNPVNASTDWATHFDYDMTRLNNINLFLSALLDVNAAAKTNGKVLRYDSGSSKWVYWTPSVPPL